MKSVGMVISLFLDQNSLIQESISKWIQIVALNTNPLAVTVRLKSTARPEEDQASTNTKSQQHQQSHRESRIYQAYHQSAFCFAKVKKTEKTRCHGN